MESRMVFFRGSSEFTPSMHCIFTGENIRICQGSNHPKKTHYQPSAQHPVRWRGTFGGPLKTSYRYSEGPPIKKSYNLSYDFFSAINIEFFFSTYKG